jgi:hypothetical protein
LRAKLQWSSILAARLRITRQQKSLRAAAIERQRKPSMARETSRSRNHNFEIVARDDETTVAAPIRFFQEIENVDFQCSRLLRIHVANARFTLMAG